jgi:hypothetical protein
VHPTELDSCDVLGSMRTEKCVKGSIQQSQRLTRLPAVLERDHPGGPACQAVQLWIVDGVGDSPNRRGGLFGALWLTGFRPIELRFERSRPRALGRELVRLH